MEDRHSSRHSGRRCILSIEKRDTLIFIEKESTYMQRRETLPYAQNVYASYIQSGGTLFSTRSKSHTHPERRETIFSQQRVCIIDREKTHSPLLTEKEPVPLFTNKRHSLFQPLRRSLPAPDRGEAFDMKRRKRHSSIYIYIYIYIYIE